MCDRCRNDVALPNDDKCRACLDELANQKVRRLQVAYAQVCEMFHTPGCTPEHPCGDCVEFAAYPRDAA